MPPFVVARGPRAEMTKRWGRYFAPKEPIPGRIHVSTSAVAVVGILVAWSILTYGGLVNPIFLPSPSDVLRAAYKMAANGSLWVDMQASVFVILAGYLLSTIIAVPVGIVMGSFRIVEAFIEPITGFVRYLPVSAMIPLLILWIGIDWKEKVAVIFIGTFFQQVILIADVSANVSKDLVDVSYTLGAGRTDVVSRVLIPATLPGVVDNLRITMGWAWTYLVVAELVAADQGLAYMILNSMRGLHTDRIFVGILVIGLLGITTDQLFKLLHRTCLPWSPRA
jgi:NitT/TauT family transport system permease protein